MKLQSLRSATLACAIGIALLPAAATAARSEFSPKDGLLLNAEHAAPAYHLRVIAPDGAVYEKVFNAGETINLRSEQLKAGWIDGAYRYELTPVRGTGIRAESQAGGAHAVAAAEGESGSFRIEAGHAFLPTDMPETQASGAAHTASQSAVVQNAT